MSTVSNSVEQCQQCQQCQQLQRGATSISDGIFYLLPALCFVVPSDVQPVRQETPFGRPVGGSRPWII